ncbi:cytochrome P450 [Astrocystis sublimbata]|nr:cytochrome P450 [Astrocystis sublimbata]
MDRILDPARGTWLVILLAVAFFFGRRAMLPKPLAGIPYNQHATKNMFGDVPEMIRYVRRTQRIFAFIKPASLPWVIVTDPFEAQDILLRRKEFDRSGFFREIIGGILPETHIQFLSADARFKDNRNLINHLMAPTFISTISAPEVYKSMAQGRPFPAHRDITYASLDSIFASSFGLPKAESITFQRLEAVLRCDPEVPPDVDEPVSFPDSVIPEPFASVLTLTDSVKDTQLSPAPVLTSWIIRKLPYLRKATAIKDQYILSKVEASVALIDSGDKEPHNALHSVLLREQEVAAKEDRQPAYYKRAIADEFFGFMMAGHDTSATTVAWGVKMLTDNSGAQDKLRAVLRAEYAEAFKEGRTLTYAELARANIPFLDAVVEEVLRHANSVAFVARQALQDTSVLGRQIPKGTDVFLVANGAGYLEPHIPVSDDMRSPGARRGGGKPLTGAWDDGDIAAFRPERWLRPGSPSDTEMMFDPMAGPQLAFGLGPRGCFGKRLALQTLKMQFALIVWHFHRRPTPARLGGYDAVQKFAREPRMCYVRLENALG